MMSLILLSLTDHDLIDKMTFFHVTSVTHTEIIFESTPIHPWKCVIIWEEFQ